MTLSDLSIKNPVFAWMLMLGLLLFGAIGFSRMGVSQMPDVDFPVISVTLSWEGAAPAVIETEIVDPVEEALMTVDGIKEISSVARQGRATVSAEFVLSKNIDVAVQEVQAKIAQAQRRLPRDMDPPVINKVNPEDQPIMWIAVSGEKPLKDLSRLVRDEIKDRFQTVPGVGEVFLGGFAEPNLRVWVDPQKLAALELSVDDVVNALESQHAEVPAGRLESGPQERQVRVMGEAETTKDFERLAIPARVGGGALWRTIRLGQVAQIEDGTEDVRRRSRVMGKPAVGLGIRKQRGSNAVAVAQGVKKRMAEVQKDLPEGVSIGVNFDSTKFISESIHEINLTLVLATLLTGLVCWAFLGSWSTTFNVLLAIPTSIGGAFMVMYFAGFTLNTFTLLGLSLVIGIVVDDAIMVLENIVRHREKGEGRVRAAMIGAREITFAAIAASVAILAIFLPVAFMKGIIGKFFFQFGVTVSVAVAFSLLEAITIAPMRCSQYLEVGRHSGIGRLMERLMSGLAARYRALLERALEHRWKVIAASVLIFVGSLSIFKVLRKEMMPAQDQGMFMVRVQTHPGSSLGFTDQVFSRVERWMMERPEVTRYFGAIGGFGGGEVDTAMMFVTLKDPKSRPKDAEKGRALTQQELMQVARKSLNKLPGMQRAVLMDPSQQGFSAGRGFPVEFSVRGPDWDKLGELAKVMMKRLADTGLAVDVDTDYRVGVPEVRVVPDREKAGARGVTVASVARAINATIGGVRVGKYTQGGRRYDIRVSLADEQRRRVSDISSLYVRNNRGELIRLSEVTAVQERPALLSINRKDRERAVGVFANVSPGASQSQVLAEAERIAKEVLPEGYRIVFSGSAATFKETFRDLTLALVLGIVIAYMVMGAQFNSFIHPFTVLLALPFSLTGALVALWLGGHSLNMMSFIGLILLMGIVKKNSILLVEFANSRREHPGLGAREAMLDAGPVRLRPILMTTVSTVAGALPAALSIGPGAEARAPMALAVIGGVLLSTLLTLFVVPCAYTLLSGLESHRHKDALRQAEEELGREAEAARR